MIRESTTIEASPRRLRRIAVVINPATRQDPNRIAEIVLRAAPEGVEVLVRETAPGVSVAEILGRDAADADAVIAAGGDGTVAAVATALGDGGTLLGIIPAGSTNIIAREHGIPTDAIKAARLIFGSHDIHRIDAGVCGTHRFLHMAGAGIDSRLFLAADSAAKRKRGWLAYVGPTLRSLRSVPSRFGIEADGTSIEVVSPLVLIANGTSILTPFFPTLKSIRPDDGLLDVIVFTAVRPVAVATALGRLVTRSLDRSAYVTRIPAQSVRITADPPLPVELDGDVVAETPAEFSVAHHALRLIVPRQ